MHARLGLTLVRTRDYPRPSFAPAERRCERGSGLAERGYPRRIPSGSPDRDPSRRTAVPHRTRPRRTGRVHPPPRRPRSNRPDRHAPRLHRARAPAPRVRHRSPGTYRGQRVSVVSTGHRHGQRRDRRSRRSWPSRSGPPSSGSARAARSSRRWRLGDLVITTGAVRLEATTSFFVHDGYPAVADYEAVVALIEAADAAGTPLSRRDDGHGAGLLRCAGAPDPAACPSATLTSPRRWRASAS